MKMNKYLSLLMLPLVFTACQDDGVLAEQQQKPVESQGLYKLYGAVQTDWDSRAQVVLNNQQEAYESFIWNKGDSIAVYNLYNGQTEVNWFSIDANYSDDNPSSSAYFGSPTELDAGQVYAAVYPTRHILNGSETYADIELEINDKIYNVSTDGWKNYFSDNMFMHTNFEARQDSSSIYLEHLTSLARITYTNNTSEARYIQEVRFIAPGLCDFKGINFDPNDNSPIYDRGSSAVRVWFQDDLLKVEAGQSEDIYVIFFPIDRVAYDETIKIEVDSYPASSFMNETVSSTSEIDASMVLGTDMSKTWKAGGRYWFNITQNDASLAWTNNLDGNYYVKGTDSLFIKALEDRYFGVKFVRNEEGWVDVEENQTVFDNFTTIDLSVAAGQTLTFEREINCLQYFTNLAILNLDNVDFYTIDLSKNEKLDSLSCVGSTVNYLNLNHNQNLKKLDCSGSHVRQLRFYLGMQLTHLNCANSELSHLRDIGYCESLKTLNCTGNRISVLDISELSQLETLVCGNQKDGISLELILTEDQKAIWDSTWSKDDNNGNVTLNVK